MDPDPPLPIVNHSRLKPRMNSPYSVPWPPIPRSDCRREMHLGAVIVAKSEMPPETRSAASGGDLQFEAAPLGDGSVASCSQLITSAFGSADHGLMRGRYVGITSTNLANMTDLTDGRWSLRHRGPVMLL